MLLSPLRAMAGIALAATLADSYIKVVMRSMSLARLATTLVLVVVVGSCSDLTAPRGRTPSPGTAPSKNLPKEIAWFTCASYDGGESWTCEYTGTEIYAPDYWDGGGNLQTTTDCSYNHTIYCDQTLRSGPNHGAYGDEASNETTTHEQPLSNLPPDCTAPRNIGEKAYCSGVPPTGARLARLNAALDAMDAIGGVCSTLAAIGRQLVDSNTIRVFVQNDFPGFGGRSPPNGAHSDPADNEWSTIGDVWFDAWYDADHKSSIVHDRFAPRDLQQLLAHELDHLNGETTHLGGNPALTQNSQICSGL
jgi:hypothetical protein